MDATDRIALCFLAADAAFGRVESACASLGLHAVRITRAQGLRAQPFSTLVALFIYDLECPEPHIALEIVHQFHTQYPGRPVLLYYKRTPIAAGLASRLGQRLGVTTLAQLAVAPDEIRELGRFIRGLIMHAPDLLIRTLIEVLLHQSRGGTIWRFVDALLARLEAAEPGAPPVEELAQRAELDPRSLRRACRAAQAPNPERLTEWLTFIYVLDLARWESISVSRTATNAGLNETYIPHLRAKLVPEIPPLRSPWVSHALTQAIMRFGKECGLAREQAAEATRQIVGEDAASHG